MATFDLCDFSMRTFVHVTFYVRVDRFIFGSHYPIAWLIFPGCLCYRSTKTLSYDWLLRSVHEICSRLVEIGTKTCMECCSIKKHNPLFISCDTHRRCFWLST